MTQSIFYTTHSSPIGELLIVGSAKGVRFIRLLEVTSAEEELREEYPGQTITQLDGFFDGVTAAIDAYLTHGSELKIPYDLAGGTPLQRAVWLAIARIPYGETISYTTLADRVGFPRAIRAVASACGANPVPLAIPCHRVVAKDGSLGGFSLGGLYVKEQLLAVENGKQSVAA